MFEKVNAVRDNMDSRALKIVLLAKEIVEMENNGTFITHGLGDPYRIEVRVRKTLE